MSLNQVAPSFGRVPPSHHPPARRYPLDPFCPGRDASSPWPPAPRFPGDAWRKGYPAQSIPADALSRRSPARSLDLDALSLGGVLSTLGVDVLNFDWLPHVSKDRTRLSAATAAMFTVPRLGAPERRAACLPTPCLGRTGRIEDFHE